MSAHAPNKYIPATTSSAANQTEGPARRRQGPRTTDLLAESGRSISLCSLTERNLGLGRGVIRWRMGFAMPGNPGASLATSGEHRWQPGSTRSEGNQPADGGRIMAAEGSNGGES